jgi:hypothetical protein
MGVVVPLVVAQHPPQVPLTIDQQVVERLASQRAHESFGTGVRARRSRRRSNDPYRVAGEDLIEGPGKLASAVPDEEFESIGALFQVHQQVPRLLGGPGSGWVGGDAEDVDTACFDLHDEEPVQALEEHGVDVQKVTCQDAGRLRGILGGMEGARRTMGFFRGGRGSLPR